MNLDHIRQLRLQGYLATALREIRPGFVRHPTPPAALAELVKRFLLADRTKAAARAFVHLSHHPEAPKSYQSASLLRLQIATGKSLPPAEQVGSLQAALMTWQPNRRDPSKQLVFQPRRAQ